jgi:hypothetical protein
MFMTIHTILSIHHASIVFVYFVRNLRDFLPSLAWRNDVDDDFNL